MKHKHTITLLTALTLASSAAIALADPVESFLDDSFGKLEEIVPGQFGINYRIRYELTDTGIEAKGISHRVRYNYTTPDFNGLTSIIEGETLTSVEGGFNGLDTVGTGTEVNQLWAQYANTDHGKIKLGRQIYTLDDQRFIGHVGWRQNIQTFDALTGSYTGVDKLTVNGFYIDQVNRVVDTNVQMDAIGVNIAYAFGKGLKLTAFNYEIDDSDMAGFENETLGLRATGAFTFSDQTFKYAVSIAEQENASGDSGYIAGDLSMTLANTPLFIGGGVEILDEGFRTPLATVHKFNGFADKFAGTSLSGGLTSGLEDFYLYASYKIPLGNGIATKVIYHWFEPTTGGEGGSELDFVASYKINKYFSLVGKYGDYAANSAVAGYFKGDKKIFTFELNFKR